jgi:hypothetical protein
MVVMTDRTGSVPPVLGIAVVAGAVALVIAGRTELRD